MSTILDALKRIEKEEDRPEKSGPSADWLDAPSVDESVLGRASGFFLSRSRTFWVVCAGVIFAGAVLAAVGTGFFPLPKGRDRVQEQPPVLEEAVARSTPEWAEAPAARRDPAGRTAVRNAPPPSPVPAAPAPARRIPAAAAPVPKAAQKPIPAAPAAPRTAVSKNVGRPAAENAGPVQRPAPAKAEEDERKAAGTVDRSPSMESLPDAAGLSLQAISWSEQPARRIAVINTRILKEGEKIEEYTVLEINRDDVVFQHQGQLWKLAFPNK